MKNHAFKTVLLLVLFCAYPISALAQADEHPEYPDAGEDPMPQAFIDVPVYLLFVAALALGIYFTTRTISNPNTDALTK